MKAVFIMATILSAQSRFAHHRASKLEVLAANEISGEMAQRLV